MKPIEKMQRDQYVADHGDKSLSVLLDTNTAKAVMVKSHDQVQAKLVEIESLKEYEVDALDMFQFPLVLIDEGRAFQMQMLADKNALENLYATWDRLNAVERYCVTGILPVA